MISFPPGTEMFQFPGFAPYGLYIQPQVTPSGCPVTPGFPIRKSPDHSLFDSSPRHIAAYYVLHRFSTPRHPPCTLHSLTTIMRGCCGNDLPAQQSVTKPYLLPALEISIYWHPSTLTRTHPLEKEQIKSPPPGASR